MDIGKVDLSKEVMDVLNQYSADIDDIVNDEIKKIARKALKELRNNSKSFFGGSGEYAKGWKMKEIKSKGIRHYEVIIHNATKPGLPHLLEKGHDVNAPKADRYSVALMLMNTSRLYPKG